MNDTHGHGHYVTGSGRCLWALPMFLKRDCAEPRQAQDSATKKIDSTFLGLFIIIIIMMFLKG